MKNYQVLLSALLLLVVEGFAQRDNYLVAP